MPLLGLTAPAEAGSVPQWMTGVNISGGELNWPQTRIFWDYVYPSQAQIAYYARKGFKVIRVPVLMGRVLSQSLGAGSDGGPDWQALAAVISQAAAVGCQVIVDVHQYGTMPSAGLIGRDAAATTDFVTKWIELAKRLRSAPNVIFGLMNEPNAQSATEWLDAVNQALAGMRRAGANQLVLIPGSYWDGAWTWTGNDNARVMLGVRDPVMNYAFEVHQYLDQWSTGATADVVTGSGKTRLAAFTAWARANHVKGFFGEFGFATTPAAMAEGEDMLKYLSQNKDVWRGWTYWAGGAWWGPYMFSVEPSDGADKPQMSLLTKYK